MDVSLGLKPCQCWRLQTITPPRPLVAIPREAPSVHLHARRCGLHRFKNARQKLAKAEDDTGATPGRLGQGSIEIPGPPRHGVEEDEDGRSRSSDSEGVRRWGKGGGVDHKSEVRQGIHPARTPPRRSRGNQPGAHRATDLFEPVWEGRVLSASPRTFARGAGRSSDALWSGRIAKESVRGPWHLYSGSIFSAPNSCVFLPLRGNASQGTWWWWWSSWPSWSLEHPVAVVLCSFGTECYTHKPGARALRGTTASTRTCLHEGRRVGRGTSMTPKTITRAEKPTSKQPHNPTLSSSPACPH